MGNVTRLPQFAKKVSIEAETPGCAWYTGAGWKRLRQLADDRDPLDDTFDDCSAVRSRRSASLPPPAARCAKSLYRR